MIKINRQVDYALQLIFALHKQKKGDLLSLKTFSAESTISFLFLQKIARSLREAKLIQATKGPTGGYELTKASDQITLREVVEAVQGAYGPSDCTRKGQRCSQEHACTVIDGLKKIHTHMIQFMESMSVADMYAEMK